MIEILNPGWHTSIQDQGRMGLQELVFLILVPWI